MAGIEVDFLDWMKFFVPAPALLLFPVWGFLLMFFKPEMKHLKKTKQELKQEYVNLPAMNREEIITLVIFLMTVILWMCSPFISRITGLTIPIMIALAQNIGIAPLTIAMPAALTTSMAVAGVFVTLIASVIVSLVIFGVSNLTGLY